MSGEGAFISSAAVPRIPAADAEADGRPFVRLGDLTLTQLYDIIDARLVLRQRQAVRIVRRIS